MARKSIEITRNLDSEIMEHQTPIFYFDGLNISSPLSITPRTLLSQMTMEIISSQS